MPRFVDSSEVKVIRAPWWGERETCTIRRFSYGDRQYLAGQTVAVGIRPGDDADSIGEVQVARMNLATLERGIASWTDQDGEPVPVTTALIESLEERDAEFILEELGMLNPRRQRDAEEQATFRGSAGDGAAERERAAA